MSAKKEAVTHKQYLDAVKTIHAYRKQVMEHSRQINTEVSNLKLNAKKLSASFDYTGCSKDTFLVDVPMSGRLYHVFEQHELFKGRMLNTTLAALAELSEKQLMGTTNFGVACLTELNALCKHIGIKIKP